MTSPYFLSLALILSLLGFSGEAAAGTAQLPKGKHSRMVKKLI